MRHLLLTLLFFLSRPVPRYSAEDVQSLVRAFVVERDPESAGLPDSARFSEIQ